MRSIIQTLRLLRISSRHSLNRLIQHIADRRRRLPLSLSSGYSDSDMTDRCDPVPLRS